MSFLRGRVVVGSLTMVAATIGAFEASALLPPVPLATGPQTVAAPSTGAQEPQQPPEAQQAQPEAQQAQPEAQQAQPEVAPAPQPIPEGDILARADLVAEALRRIERFIEPVENVTQIGTDLGGRELRIEALRSELDRVDLSRISTRRLEDMRLPWLNLEHDLASWSATTRARFDALQDGREYLRDARARWELTLEPSDTVELGPELASRAESVLARVIEVEAQTRAQRNAVGAIADRIATSREAVSDALERIDSIALELRGRLLWRNAPPLWVSLGGLEAAPLAADAVAAVRAWEQGLVDYVRLFPGRYLLLIALFVLLLVGALRLRRWSRDPANPDEMPEVARELLDRPLSLALAAGLVISLLVLPLPTGSATDVIFALAAVPTIRLGAIVLESRMHRALVAAITLTLLTRIASVGPSASPSSRLFLLLVTGVAMALVVHKVRVFQRQDPPRGSFGRAALALTVGAVGILAVALAANLFGWVQLSGMLTEAIVASFFSAFGWAVIVASTAALSPVAVGDVLGRAFPSLRREKEAVTRVIVRVAFSVALLMWLRATLARFQARDPLLDALGRIGASEFSIGGLTIDVGGLFGGIVLIAATWLFARLLRFFLREEVVPRLRLRRGSAQSMVSLANYVVWGLGITMAASAAGLTGTQLAVVVGALSVGIGFGLQTIVNNFVSGLILIFERPIKVGDTVQTPSFYGRVERIGIRASVIRSFEGAEIIVPNGDLISREVTNWTGTDELRRAEVIVGVEYGTDPERVIEVLLRVAREQPKALADPEPQAQMIRFGESSLDFRLRCWTPIADSIDLSSELHVAINRELQAAGITIPFPQRDLHIKGSAAEGELDLSSTRGSASDPG